VFVDSHNHLLDYLEKLYKKDNFTKEELLLAYDNLEVIFCTSSNEEIRFTKQEAICNLLNSNVHPFHSFGIHPQAPSLLEIPFLEKLLKLKKIVAIGECGFDLFDDKNRLTIEQQKEVWNIQLELAIKYDMPIIIHCRHALHLIFKSTLSLKKIKAVIFHGWAGSFLEATSILKRKINAYFCIGKALLRGQKSQIEMASKFELKHLLTETDAPYMKLKDENYSKPCDIKIVSNYTSLLRKINTQELNKQLYENFQNVFLI